MLQALLVDDSIGSLRTLRNLLKKFCPQVEIVGEADSPEKAYELMLSQKPNLLLLDIEMPFSTGFDLLDRAKDLKFEVIFITAHKQYALEAIKHRALDYILKPIGHINLMEAIEKAENRIAEQQNRQATSGQSSTNQSQNVKFPIPTTSGFEFLPLDQIVYLEADGIYTNIFTVNAKKIVTTLRLMELESRLEDKGFFRIHRSFIINLNFIRQYVRGNGGYVVMEDGSDFPVARSRKDLFLERLKM